MHTLKLLRVVSLCVCFINVKSKCVTTFINTCDSTTDIKRYGQNSWKNLIIAKNLCENTAENPNEILKTDAFTETPALEELYIYQRLVEVNTGAFNGLDQLTYLKLYKNSIKIVPKGTFSNLSQVFKLDLQDNAIENIEHGLFDNSSITSINLSFNKLNNLQVGQLDLPKLRKLTVTNNDISFLAPKCFHTNLENLNLDHNRISDIDKGVLDDLKRLKVLVLSNNKIKGITQNFNLHALEKLDLTHNEIAGIEDNAFNDFYELRTLLLGHNRLKFLSHNIFLDTSILETLHVHNNMLINLDPNLGAKLHALKEITLSGNPWVCPCLVTIQTYMNDNHIKQPNCDKRYFNEGLTPVCIRPAEACFGNETLSKEDYDSFNDLQFNNYC